MINSYSLYNIQMMISAVAFFALTGVTPLYLLGILLRLKQHQSVLIAATLGPVLPAGFHVFALLLGASPRFTISLLAVIINCALLVSLWRRRQLPKIMFERKIAIGIIQALCSGILLWLITFFFYPHRNNLYQDVLWNVGTTAELMQHFPPMDPHWKAPGYFMYHWLGNLITASFGAFARVEAAYASIITMPLITWGLIATTARFSFFKRNSGLRTFAFLLLLFCFTSDHFVNNEFVSHMSFQAASTFFWSFPILIGGLGIWLEPSFLLGSSSKKAVLTNCVFRAVLLFIAAFAKGTTAVLFASTDMCFFLLQIYQAIKTKRFSYRRLSLSFGYAIFSVAVFLIIQRSCFSSVKSMADLLVVSDANLSSGLPASRFLSTCLTFLALPLIYFLSSEKSGIQKLYLTILMLGSQLFLGIFSRFPGLSEVYFLFNAHIVARIGILFLTFNLQRAKYVALGFALLALTFADTLNTLGINPTNVKRGFEGLGGSLQNSISAQSPLILALRQARSLIPAKNTLIAAPSTGCGQQFIYSAFLERRIWDECPLFNAGNQIAMLSDLAARQEPYYGKPFAFSPTPEIMKGHAQVLEEEKLQTQFLTDSTEWSSTERKRLSNEFAFSHSITENDCIKFVKKTGITHMIMFQNEISKIGTCLANEPKSLVENLAIFQIH